MNRIADKNRRRLNSKSPVAAASQVTVEAIESRLLMSTVTAAAFQFTGAVGASPALASINSSSTGIVVTNGLVTGAPTLSQIGLTTHGQSTNIDITSQAGTAHTNFSEYLWRLRSAATPYAITSLVAGSGTGTVTVTGNASQASTGNGLSVGDLIKIAGMTPSTLNNASVALTGVTYNSGPNTTTLTYSTATTGTATAFGTATSLSYANGWVNNAPRYSQGAEIDLNLNNYTALNSLSFDWYATTSGAKDMVIQYNTDISNGSGWTDVPLTSGELGGSVSGTEAPILAGVNDYYGAGGIGSTPQVTVDLSGITTAAVPSFANDLNGTKTFGLRLVSTYDPNFPSSTLYSAANSLTTSQTTISNTGGNWRFNNITVVGQAPLATITQNPTTPSPVVSGTTDTFTAAATGSTSVQWQYSTNGSTGWTNDTTDAGNTTTTLSVVASPSNENYFYRAVFTNAVGSKPTTGAQLTLLHPAAITSQPASAYYTNEDPSLIGFAQYAGTGVTPVDSYFNVSAKGNPAPTITWYVKTTGSSSFVVDTTDTATTTTTNGVTTSSLAVPWTEASPGTPNTAYAQYQAVVTNTTSGTTNTATSSTVSLTELPAPAAASLPSPNIAYEDAITAWNFGTLESGNGPYPGSYVGQPVGLNANPTPSLNLNGNGAASEVGMNSSGSNYPTPNATGPSASDIIATDNNSSDNFDGGNEWRVRGTNGWQSSAPIGSQGAQFTGSTQGYSNIFAKFDLYTTTQGEGLIQVEYTTDGQTWNNVPASLLNTNGTPGIKIIDGSSSATNPTSGLAYNADPNIVHGGMFQVTTGQGWFDGLTANLSGVLGIANNPDFGFRVVNAATGADCLAATNTPLNNTSGNWRFDEVQITGSNLTSPTPTITTQPSPYVVPSLGASATFTAAASVSDGGTLSEQWQYKAPGGVWTNDTTDSGNTTNSLTVVSSAGNVGYQYRAQYTDSLQPGYPTSTSPALLSLYVAPGTPTAPANAFVSTFATAGTASFTSTDATGTALSVQWQYNANDGSGWHNDTASGDTGATTNTLTVGLPANGGTAHNGYQYRAVFTNTPVGGSAASVNSTAAVLTTLGTEITGWNFSVNGSNNAIGTNLTPTPSAGTGTAASIGMASSATNTGMYTEAAGLTAANATGPDSSGLFLTDGLSSDGANGGNYWKIYGSNGWNNNAGLGTQGAQFLTSTVGSSNIVAKFDWYVSTQGEGNAQVQYTTNGTTWTNVPAADLGTNGDAGIAVVDGTSSAINYNSGLAYSADPNIVHGGILDVTGGQGWYNGLTVNLASISGVNNNSNFGLRIVNAAVGGDAVNSIGAPLNNTSGNWRFDEVQVTSTLPAAVVAVTPPTSGTYNGSAFTGASATVSENGTLLSSPSLTFTYTNTATNVTTSTAVNAGTYIVTAAYPGDTNFGPSFGTATFTIGQAALSISANAGQSFTYGSSVPALTYTTGTLAGAAPTFTGALATTATSSSNVGSYPISIGSLADSSGNYVLTLSGSPTVSVTQASLTVTANAGQSFTYGSSVPTLGYTLGTVAGAAPTFTGALATTATSSSNAGSYPITIGTLAETSGNYALTLSGSPTLLVTPASLAITSTGPASFVYGSSVPTLTYTTGTPVGAAPTLTGALATTASSSSNVGSYPISIGTLADTSGNYTLTLSGSPMINVTKASLAITANAGQSFTYGSSVPTLGYTVGTLAGAAPTLTGALSTTATSASTVASYPISIGTLADSSGNYSLTLAGTPTISVTPATPTASVNPLTIDTGTALTDSLLTGTSSVLGHFTFTAPEENTVLTVAGSPHTETVIFTPTDTTDYTTLSSLTVPVTVLPTPTVPGQSFSINSKAVSGTVVGTITGVTTPNSDPATYTLSKSSSSTFDPTGIFAISSTGVITVTGTLPTSSFLIFNLTAKDTTTNLSATNTVTISLTSTTKMAPTFSTSPLSLPSFLETAAAGKTVGTVVAVKAYTGQALIYSIAGTTNFTINASTGVITNTGPVNYANTPYTFTVTATDGVGGPSASVVVTLPVTLSAPTVHVTATTILVNDVVNGVSQTVKPLNGTSITDVQSTRVLTATLTLGTPANGTLSLTAGAALTLSSTTPGTYTLTGTATQLTAAMAELLFTPTPHQIAPKGVESTILTIQVADSYHGSATGLPVTIKTTAVNTTPKITGAPTTLTSVVSIHDGGSVGAVTATPFSTVAIVDPDFGATETVTISLGTAAMGTLAEPSGFAGAVSFAPVSGKPGYYSATGTVANVNTAIDALVFTPAARKVAPGATFITKFTIADTDSIAAATSNTNTEVTVTAQADTAPTLAGVPTTGATNDTTAIKPFAAPAAVTVTDPDAGNTTFGTVIGQTETVTLTLGNAALGTLTGTGVTATTTAGVYTIKGTSAVVTTDLATVKFMPKVNVVNSGPTGSTETIAVAVSDGTLSATPMTDTIKVTATPGRITALTATAITGLRGPVVGTVGSPITVATLKGTDLANTVTSTNDPLTYSLLAVSALPSGSPIGAGADANNADFAVSGSSLQATANLTPNTYHVLVQVTNAGGDKYYQGLTVTVKTTGVTIAPNGLGQKIYGTT